MTYGLRTLTCRNVIRGRSECGIGVAFLLILVLFVRPVPAEVVINEIHHNSDVKTEMVEFIELYNAGRQVEDLAGWQLGEAVSYTFGRGVTLAAGGYLVVAQKPSAVARKFGVSSSAVFGPFTGKLNSEGDQVILRDATGVKRDEVSYGLGFPWPTVGDPITVGKAGTGGSIQLVNPGLDNDLGGSWRSAYPTPCKRNSVYADNIAPQIRQVQHEPEMPREGGVVTITAKVTDPDGVAYVRLTYQVVKPGSYIALKDKGYKTGWTQASMNDAGRDGDAVANDGVYTVQLPASLQVHRRLIRYRIQASDLGGRRVTVPYADDPQPNFAYYCYNGAPAWVASDHPGVSPTKTFAAETMNSLPIIQLLTKKSETEKCTWLDQDDSGDYRYRGTLVYDGKVYDHVTFHTRGGEWRFAMRKNMWKFKLNRGHEMEVRDDYGHKLATKQKKLNLGACIQQRDTQRRGEQGMFEAMGFRLFNLAGVAACRTSFIQLRIVDEKNEDGRLNAAHPPLTSRGTQYDGDFWGLYLIVEEMDGRYLDEHALPDGNLYKMDGDTGDLENQSPGGKTDKSDLKGFVNGYKKAPSTSWWRANVDVAGYCSYRSIVEAIHHYDIGGGKNYFYFLNPETAHWSVLPWDLDQTWSKTMSGTGEDPFKKYGALNKSSLQIQYQGRLRELRDLLFNPEQTGRLIDEYAAFIYTPGRQSIVDADRAMWDYHWVMSDKAFDAGYADKGGQGGQGEFYKSARSKTFAGMIRNMKSYVAARGEWIDTYLADDANIPATPSVTPDCSSAYPIDDLRFHTSAFKSPQRGGAFGALQWRIAEVSPANVAGEDRKEWRHYEIEAQWTSDLITPFASQIKIPATGLQVGHTYRVRARMKDSSGRWSHWSAPREFVAGQALNTDKLRDNLRLTELMYDPPRGDNYEFVELKNISSRTTLDLTGVTFTNGIAYSFPAGARLSPGSFVLVTRSSDLAAFRKYYSVPSEVAVYGPYSGKLDNEGEELVLSAAGGGAALIAFDYDNSRGWPLAAQGGGHSLAPKASAIAGEPGGSLDYCGNWTASAYIKGSPGRNEPAAPASLVINEFNAHTDPRPPAESNDWIELYNPTGAAITLNSNWHLSDDPQDPRKYTFGTRTIPAGGFLALDELSGFHVSASSGFGLNKGGEAIVLSYLPGGSQDRIVDSVRFEGQANGPTTGRYPNGGNAWHVMAGSQGGPNNSPTQGIVIDEVMYHPNDDTTATEYIELYNPTGRPVNLWTTDGGQRGWRISGEVDFAFPVGKTMNKNERMLIVNFSPITDAALLAAFRAKYAVPATVRIYGPYRGSLSNRTGRISLEKAQGGDAPDPATQLNWIVEDELFYFDQAPFPTQADGGGYALQRKAVSRSGRDPDNWTAMLANPGALPYSPPVVNNKPATTITINAALLNGAVAATGGLAPEVTVYWGVTDGKTSPYFWQHKINLGSRPPGNFSVAIGGLTANTKYYYRCYSSNAVGGSWASATQSFKTPAIKMAPARSATGKSWTLY